ncbi:MAG: NADH-quinone oxidoreductase subunit C [Elusimicrobia bacterium]|nr:NADH-quinone oxidoreductase subunit C [Elusimicrobiota bacterium]
MSDIRGERRDVPAVSNHEELSKLRAEGYNMLVDLTCVDYQKQGRAPRFDVIYRLMRLDPETGKDLGRVEVHCAVDEAPVLRSVKDVWPAADWLEREVWDMFGVKFADRPGIKRLLMYEEFTGHPLRKDYPIAKRQPLIGPKSGDKADSPSFNILRPTVTGE